MKRQHIDAALTSLCGLFAVAGILGSAGGVEQVGVVLLAIVLSAATIIVGSLLICYRRHTERAALPALAVPVICLGVIISVAASHWPLRVTYALSRNDFD